MVLHGRIFSSCCATVLGAIDPFLSLAMVKSVLPGESGESGFEAFDHPHFSSSPLVGAILSGPIVTGEISNRLKIDDPVLV